MLSWPATPAQRDLQLDICLVGGFGLHRVLGFCRGFSFEASGVSGSDLPGRVVGGETLGCSGGAAKQPVKPGCLVIRAGLAISLGGGPGTAFPLGHGLSLGLGVALGWPGLACGDRGLVLALDGAVYGGGAGFELAPPLHHALRSAFGLPLLRYLPGEPAPAQFGPGLTGCFPPPASVRSPRLIASVRGFELLAPGRHVAGERLRARRFGQVVLDLAVGGLLPGVGLGLRGEPQFPGDIGRSPSLGSFPVDVTLSRLRPGKGR